MRRSGIHYFFKQTSIFQILRGIEGHHQCVKFVLVLTGRQGWLLLALSRAARFLLRAKKQWKKQNISFLQGCG